MRVDQMKKLLTMSLMGSVLLAGCGPMNNEGVGTLTGGVVGGLIGSQFGGGSGKVAAAAGGALLGAFLGGKIGRTMDRQDQIEMQMALETAPTGTPKRWVNPNNGNRYVVTPRRTYYVEQQPCREYVTSAVIGGKTEKIYGTACRQADGSWQIQH
jgi:surface antigen